MNTLVSPPAGYIPTHVPPELPHRCMQCSIPPKLPHMRAVFNTVNCEKIDRQRCNLQVTECCTCTKLLKRRKRVAARAAYNIQLVQHTSHMLKRASKSPRRLRFARNLSRHQRFTIQMQQARVEAIPHRLRAIASCEAPERCVATQVDGCEGDRQCKGLGRIHLSSQPQAKVSNMVD
jgi:hypothetical protein